MSQEKSLVAELDQIQSDLLCSAFEGGSNYWCRIKKINAPPGAKMEYPHLEAPFKGGEILVDAQGEHNNSARLDKCWVLNKKALTSGWELMKNKYARHYADAATGDADATTGDVYLQLCLFGEIIFG